MKKEICVVVFAGLGLFVTGLLAGSRYGRAQNQGSEPTVSKTNDEGFVPPNSDLQSCIDDGRREQLNYIDWSGRHARHLEACTDALGEATRALVRRRP